MPLAQNLTRSSSEWVLDVYERSLVSRHHGKISRCENDLNKPPSTIISKVIKGVLLGVVSLKNMKDLISFW